MTFHMEFALALALLLAWTNQSVGLPKSSYANVRKQILEYERGLMFGGNLQLNDVEEAANEVLMEAKRKELEFAFENPSSYLPGRNFLTAKKDIEKSEVYKKIRRMPKGAVLHTHDTAILSSDFIYHNVSFREHFYICDKNGTLAAQFFHQPNEECDWELLSEVRKDPRRSKQINSKIMKEITMVCENPDEEYTTVDKAWEKLMDIFVFITPILTYKPVFEDHFYKALEELYEDNIMYVEIRTTMPNLYDLDGTVYKPSEVVEVYKTVSERFIKDHPDFQGVKVIYAPMRLVNRETASEYLDLMVQLQKEYPHMMAGFDLVGQEDKGQPLKYFADVLIQADPNISFFFHAGETNWYGMETDENIIDAILLNTRRIGHGYALDYHPFLLEIAKRMNIAVEVNPISNQVLKLVSDMRNHAARRLFAGGYPVVISNDDPGLWGASALSYDFYEAFMGLMSAHSDLRALKQLAQNSLMYSSLNDEEKKTALKNWEKKWNDFVKALANREF